MPKPGSKGSHHKVRERLAWDHAIVAVDTIVESSAGVVRDARVVMGGVAPIPWRATKAEDFLRGKRLDEATAKQAGEIALRDAKPLKDNGYKVKLAQDLIQRGLLASV
jgi:xanthine dehydrogenase YagS FAD-binding subunit